MKAHKEHVTPWWVFAFTILLMLLPLPFGGNRPWASNLFGCLNAIVLLGTLFCFMKEPLAINALAPKKTFIASGALFSLVVAWAFVQIAPWTPESWHHPIWLETQTLTHNETSTISVDPSSFTEAMVRLLSYATCFLLAFFVGLQKDGAKLFLRFFVLASVAYAIYGLIVYLAGSNTILWFDKWAYEGFVTSTFVNKNSYATYAGLGLLASFAMIWQRVKKLPFSKKKDINARINALINELTFKDLCLFVMPLVILCALVLTGSRAGLSSTLLGCLVFVLGIAVNRRWSPAKWGALLSVALFFFFLFVFIGGDLVSERSRGHQFEDDASVRLSAYALEETAIGSNPVLGFGLGTFDKAFRLYRDDTLPLWFHRAHNDFLEMAMDLGIPAALGLWVAIGLFVLRCLKGIWTRKRSEYFPVLAVSATVLVSAHSLADFGMHIPAIAATYAALLGLGVSQSWSSKD